MLWCNLLMSGPMWGPVGDEITALGEALFQRIQWQRKCIEIPPMKRDTPNSGSTSSSSVPHLHLKSASPYSHVDKEGDEWAGAGQQYAAHHHPQTKPLVQEQTPPPPPNHKALPDKGGDPPITSVWTKQNSKYKNGEPMLSEEDLNVAGHFFVKPCISTTWYWVHKVKKALV